MASGSMIWMAGLQSLACTIHHYCPASLFQKHPTLLEGGIFTNVCVLWIPVLSQCHDRYADVNSIDIRNDETLERGVPI